MKHSYRLLYIRGTRSQNDIALAMVRQIAGGYPLESSPTDHEKPKNPYSSDAMETSLIDQADLSIPSLSISEILSNIDSTYHSYVKCEFHESLFLRCGCSNRS